MKRLISIIFCLLLVTTMVSAEDYDSEKIFDLIDRSSGLNNLSVSGIIQDKYGFLWFATQGGLNRYDGTEFTTFRSDPFDDNTLVNNLIQSIFYDEEEHVLWLGTYQGVSRFDIDEEAFQHYTVSSHGLSDPVITSIIKKGDKIWIGSLGGLDCLNTITEQVTTYEIPGNVVRDLVFDGQDTLYIATYEGLFYFDGGIKQYNIDLPSNYVMAMEHRDDILTIGMWDGGLIDINLRDGTLKSYQFDDNRVYALMIDKMGNKWVGTWGGGLFVMEDEKISSYPGTKANRDISHSIVYSLYEDDSGIVWIGTNGGGINKWNPRKTSYEIYSPTDEGNSISDGKVNAIHAYNDKLYIGMYDKGLNVFDFKTGTFEKFTSENSNLHVDSINDVIAYKDKLLIATANGLTLFDGQNFMPWKIIPDNYIVYSLAYKNDVLYIGTYNKGLFVYDGNLKNYDTDNSNLSNNLIYDIHVEGLNVWIGTNEGLNVLDENDVIKVYKKEEHPQEISSNKIQSIYEDRLGDLWFGTAGGGIMHFNKEEDSFNVYTERDGLASNDVLNILEDDDGYLWVSTSDGISRLNVTTGEIYSYTPIDGIGGWEFSRGSTHLGDKLYFGGTHGITVIPTHIESKEIIPPRVYITRIEPSSDEANTSLKILNNQSITIDPSETYLVFDVVTIEYDNPDKMLISYQLLGHNDEWIHLGVNKRIAYSNLSPGDYVLQVQVIDSNNVKSEIVSVNLHVEYPWYLNPIMFVVYVLGIISLIYIIIRAREAKTFKLKNDKLSLLNQQLEDLSVTDPLTGVYNRRYLKKTLTDQLELAIRSNTYISLLMIDIDDFKDVNDQYGHLQGDKLLILLAERLKSVIQRKTDFVARYGGDEFAVVLYDTDIKGTEAMANRIHDLFNMTLDTDKHEVELNISIGLTCKLPSNIDNLDSLMKEADDCLYEAKALGKNQIQR